MSTRSFALAALLTAGACARASSLQAPIDGAALGLFDSGELIDSGVPSRGDTGVQDDAAAADARSIDAPAAQIDAAIDSPVVESCASPFTGVLATWSFSGQSGDQTSTPASATATGVTAGAISRSSGLTAVSGANSINSSEWSESSSRDGSLYYTFKVAPASDCELDLTSLSINAEASDTGPASAEVATSADTFTANAKVSTLEASTPKLTVTDAATEIELRVYGYNASSGGGTMRIETLSVTGSQH